MDVICVFTYLSLHCCSLSPPWLTCNYPSKPPKKTVLDSAIIHIHPQLSHHVEISDREVTIMNEEKMFIVVLSLTSITDWQVI